MEKSGPGEIKNDNKKSASTALSGECGETLIHLEVSMKFLSAKVFKTKIYS